VARGDVFLYEFFQPGLINRNLAVLQLVDLFEIVIHADYAMADFSEARAGDQSNVTRANDC